jgi:hypothetical protein
MSITDIIGTDENNKKFFGEDKLEDYLNYKVPLEKIINSININDNQKFLTPIDRTITIFLSLYNLLNQKWTWKYQKSDQDEIRKILNSNNISYFELGKLFII